MYALINAMSYCSSSQLCTTVQARNICSPSHHKLHMLFQESMLNSLALAPSRSVRISKRADIYRRSHSDLMLWCAMIIEVLCMFWTHSFQRCCQVYADQLPEFPLPLAGMQPRSISEEELCWRMLLSDRSEHVPKTPTQRSDMYSPIENSAVV